jgi:hypothetical protein
LIVAHEHEGNDKKPFEEAVHELAIVQQIRSRASFAPFDGKIEQGHLSRRRTRHRHVPLKKTRRGS